MSKTFWKIFSIIYFVISIFYLMTFIFFPIHFGDGIKMERLSIIPFYFVSFLVLALYAYNKKVLNWRSWNILFSVFVFSELYFLYNSIESNLMLQVFVWFAFFNYVFNSKDLWGSEINDPKNKKIFWKSYFFIHTAFYITPFFSLIYFSLTTENLSLLYSFINIIFFITTSAIIYVYAWDSDLLHKMKWKPLFFFFIAAELFYIHSSGDKRFLLLLPIFFLLYKMSFEKDKKQIKG